VNGIGGGGRDHALDREIGTATYNDPTSGAQTLPISAKSL
jgi:hypothetical protein